MAGCNILIQSRTHWFYPLIQLLCRVGQKGNLNFNLKFQITFDDSMKPFVGHGVIKVKFRRVTLGICSFGISLSLTLFRPWLSDIFQLEPMTDKYPWEKYEPPYPPNYGLNSATCPVGWSCRIHQLHLFRGRRSPLHPSVVVVMLELWGMWTTPSLPSLPDPLWPGVVATDRVLSIGQIELKCVLMLNWITWNRTVLTLKLYLH